MDRPYLMKRGTRGRRGQMSGQTKVGRQFYRMGICGRMNGQGRGSTQPMIFHVMPWMRPTSGSANWLKAWGEKSRSPKAHPSQRSTSCT